MSGPVVSKLAHNIKENVPDDSKTVFDWCKEGNKEMMEKKASGKMNQTDDQVRENNTFLVNQKTLNPIANTIPRAWD